jgi:hypothetical protein
MAELLYGLKNGILIHISDVDNGLSCNCVCAHCGKKLVAKNNPDNIKESHFAHYLGSECAGAIETTLHVLAKKILSETKRLFLPDYHYDYKSYNKKSIINYGKLITFDNVIIEKSIILNKKQIIPDAIGEIKGKKVLIEFANTHFIEKDKMEILKKSGLPCIEIDLRKQELNEKKLSCFFCSNTPFIYWVTNPRFDRIYEGQKRERERKEREKEELIKQELQKKIREAPNKVEKYKIADINNKCLQMNNIRRVVCPKSFIREKNNLIVKRIIDGEFWNSIIHENGSKTYINLNREEIDISSLSLLFICSVDEKCIHCINFVDNVEGYQICNYTFQKKDKVRKNK